MVQHIIDLPEDAHYGILLFAAERARVVIEEGYTPEHDDSHDPVNLLAAGVCYIQQALLDLQGVSQDSPPYEWPFNAESWKPSDGDTLRDIKRGAQFLAAFVDNILTEK